MKLRWRFAGVAVVSGLAAHGLTLEPLFAAAKTEETQSEITTPSEVLALLVASKNKYALASPSELRDVSPDKYDDATWPPAKAFSTMPRISKSEGGGMTLTAWPFPDGARKLLDAGDDLFTQKKFEESTAKYRELTGAFPDFYVGWLYLGDSLFSLGRYPEALEAYSKGVELNPYDYQGHLFKGHALLELRRNDEALQEWVRALAMRPHQPTVMKLLAQHRGALGIDVDDSRFKPRALVRREGKVVKIYAPPEAAWLAWGNCKALWLGEPSYRKKKTGKEEYAWSSTEEWECLVNLWASRTLELQDGKATPDEALDRIVRIGKEHMLSPMMMYEIVSRVSPDFMLLLPEDDRSRIEDYIRRYVVVHRETKPPEDPQSRARRNLRGPEPG